MWGISLIGLGIFIYRKSSCGPDTAKYVSTLGTK